MEHLDIMVALALKEFKIGIVGLLAMEKDGFQNLFLQNAKSYGHELEVCHVSCHIATMSNVLITILSFQCNL